VLTRTAHQPCNLSSQYGHTGLSIQRLSACCCCCAVLHTGLHPSCTFSHLHHQHPAPHAHLLSHPLPSHPHTVLVCLLLPACSTLCMPPSGTLRRMPLSGPPSCASPTALRALRLHRRWPTSSSVRPARASMQRYVTSHHLRPALDLASLLHFLVSTCVPPPPTHQCLGWLAGLLTGDAGWGGSCAAVAFASVLMFVEKVVSLSGHVSGLNPLCDVLLCCAALRPAHLPLYSYELCCMSRVNSTISYSYCGGPQLRGGVLDHCAACAGRAGMSCRLTAMRRRTC